ncbi:MAG: hypothetical protein PHS73_00530, partial [Candidatus Peribacteraceae bacterium]|nr:hypothetical protein [Candidatus Peribacteraceae bacterium]
MNQESQIDWSRPTSKQRVTREVSAFLQKNVSLTSPRKGHPKILGFPVGEPDAFGVEVHGNALRKNPNNIGLHTTGDEVEEGFRGSQEAERLLITMLADILGTDLNVVDGYVESGGTVANMAGLCI